MEGSTSIDHEILRCEWGCEGAVMTDLVVAQMVQDKSSTNRNSLYALNQETPDLLVMLDHQDLLSDRKLHQFGAEMIEEELPERLHQSGAEMRFPAIFGYFP